MVVRDLITTYPTFAALPSQVTPDCMPKYRADPIDIMIGNSETTTVTVGTSCSSATATYTIFDIDQTTPMTTAYTWLSLASDVVTADLTSATPVAKLYLLVIRTCLTSYTNICSDSALYINVLESTATAAGTTLQTMPTCDIPRFPIIFS